MSKLAQSVTVIFLFSMACFASGCAASFSYVPLSTSPGNVDFVYISSHRTPDTVVVQGTLGNNLGFPVYDTVIRGVGYDSAGSPVSIASALISGELDQGKGAPFELVFETAPARIVNFQLEATTAQVGGASAPTQQGGFSKTIGVGSGAVNMAESIAHATQGTASGWSAASNVFDFTNRAASAFPPAPTSSSGKEIISVTYKSPIYPVSQ